ncbi:MAG: lipopolysaccharide transport periplasmic protein LptA [Gammaproteobacteria bacterium]|nr:lipopolysaccharide transport periplasmic protein LptA [Gammaproteobacteria bacterium]
MNAKIFLFIALLVSLCALQNAIARSDDSEKPIHITADSAELNEKSGVSIYRGDVKMVQGTTILRGDIITVYTSNNEVDKMISVGDLATYQETTDDGDIVYAESEEMIHNGGEKKIELFRRGKITQAGNVIRSDYILYLTEEGLIDTGTKKDRIEITIQPKSKDNADK